MPTYRIDLEYEGTRYRGWQEQQNARSVAGELRRAVVEAGGDVAELGGAGRTDAGVHALHQVAHLRLRERIDPRPFRLAVNDALPHDIHVLALRSVPERFHARHDAVLRSYVYQIARRRTALAKRSVWWIKRPLDVGRMRSAAASLGGMHDFAAFCERPQDQGSTRVLIERSEIAEDGALILVRLVASHFLWKMVRRVVGTLVQVGGGDLAMVAFTSLLHGTDPRRSTAAWTAPPSGLFLERVLYAGDAPLPALQAATRVGEEPAQGASSKGRAGTSSSEASHRTR
jgi:tRNA pseudouridine38-40 synthase